MVDVTQAVDGNGTIPNVFEPSGTITNLDGTSGSAASSAFSKDTLVRVIATASTNADGEVYYKIGTAPTATTSTTLIYEKQAEQMTIKSGNKIAVINGKLNITEYANG